jgi:hypothetical protein
MAKYASVYLEAANAVWKDPLTSGGSWGAGKGFKADNKDELRCAVLEHRTADMQDDVFCALSENQALHKCTLIKRRTRTAMIQYMTLAEPRIARHSLSIKNPGERVTSERLESLPHHMLPTASPLPPDACLA